MQKKSSDYVKVYYPKFSRDELVAMVRERLAELSKKLPIQKVVLFGSYSQGRQTAASDVDLLFVYDDPRREDAYGIIWDTIRIPQLQIHSYARSEYERLKKSGSQLPGEVEKKGIVVWPDRMFPIDKFN